MLYNLSGSVLCNDRPIGEYTDAQCTQAFVAYMAKKCSLFGMSGTFFKNPSGLTTDSYITPQDLAKLGIIVSSVPEALSIWGTPNSSFKIGGNNERTISVENNVIAGVGTHLDNNGYKFLGGKGGSYWTSGSANWWRAGVDIVDIDGVSVVLALLAKGKTNYDNMYLSTKELCDMVSASLAGQTPVAGSNLTALVSGGGGYVACIAPDVPGAYVNLVAPSEFLSREHSISAATSISSLPASTTKTMTMLCALDYMENPYDLVTVKSVDISTGSGSTFYDGDILTMHDALRIMMMESSNTLANTIARETGRKILSYAV
jgi:D-alanyl-D-alanine carboxypeptidase